MQLQATFHKVHSILSYFILVQYYSAKLNVTHQQVHISFHMHIYSLKAVNYRSNEIILQPSYCSIIQRDIGLFQVLYRDST